MKSTQALNPEKHISSEVGEESVEMPEPDCAKAIDIGPVRDELIRQTAYSNYEARNHEEGHELLDWLAAESQVNQMPGKVSPSINT